MSALLLRTLVVCRRQQSKSIVVALDREVRRFDERLGHCSISSLVKCRMIFLHMFSVITYSRVDQPGKLANPARG